MSRVVSFTPGSIVAVSARRARPASSSRKASNPRSAPTGPLVLRPTVTSFRRDQRATATRAVGEEVEANPPSVSDPPWTQPGYRGAVVSALDEPAQTAVLLAVWAGIGALTVGWCSNLGPEVEHALPTVMSWSRATWPVIGLTYVAAGAAHFALPGGFKDMFPHKGAWGWWNLPGSPEFHVAWSGVAEIVGGLGMASGALWFLDTPDWLAPTSAYGLFLLTLAVTPANTYMFTHNAPGPLPEDADESMQTLPWYGHCARAMLQVFLLATTWGVAHPPH